MDFAALSTTLSTERMDGFVASVIPGTGSNGQSVVAISVST